MEVGEYGELGFLQKPRQTMLGLELDFEYSEAGSIINKKVIGSDLKQASCW